MKIVEQIKARRDENGTARIYPKEVAFILRAKLKGQFPGTKFSVRCDGNTINVHWTDGPKVEEVDSLIFPYKFGGYDSSIDLEYYGSNWLLPNGDMSAGESRGTAGSGGHVAGYATDCPTPGAVLVAGGPRYIFTRRKISPERMIKIIEALEQEEGIPVNHNTPYNSQFVSVRGINEFLTTLVYQYDQKLGHFAE